jgi:sulfur carrier protein
MEVFVNGSARVLPDGSTVAELVEILGLARLRLAVEINREIVPRSAYPEHRLESGDRVEIVRAIGGG